MSPPRQAPHSALRLFLSLICLALLGYAAYRWLPYSPSEQTEPTEQTAKKEAPPKPPKAIGRPVQNTLELQIALARTGFSPGSIDGSAGGQTRQALIAYQQAHKLTPTGEFDAATQAVLQIAEPIYNRIALSSADFARIDSPPSSWKERGIRSRMAYYSILEMVAEKSMSDPDLIQQLNPTLDFNILQPGMEIIAPHIPPVRVRRNISHLQISLSQRTLQAIDTAGDIVFHCPVSIARSVDKRPSGELRVQVRVAEPNYTFNPAILSGTAAREGITQKFVIQPGPNNPVGSVWIGLNLPSYGIHGTPEPEKVGRTESSGCFRLANWNAETVLELVRVGTAVYVEP